MNKDFLITLRRMNTLVRMHATGCPKEFAAQLGIAESTLYKYINVLRIQLEAPIAYDSFRKTYYYEKSGELHIGFRPLQKKEEIEINGGQMIEIFYPLHAS